MRLAAIIARVSSVARISLPDVKMSANAKAHPFPVQIGLQTKEFLQGAIFHASFTDYAVGEYVRQPGALKHIFTRMESEGLVSSEIDEALQILTKYREVFDALALQSVLVALCSHWDWYVRRLSQFVLYARSRSHGLDLNRATQRALGRVDRRPIGEQLEILQSATDLDFALPSADSNALREMYLVRNLGLHNRWEIDKRYLQATNLTNMIEGELRIIGIEELREWHGALLRTLCRTSLEVAKLYRDVGPFP